jgi:protein-disulfide isomerase
VIVYGDYECPFCAAFDARLAELAVQLCFRHFPVRTSHPRAHASACAAEADRRCDEVTARVKASFREGVRAGVATTPTAFLDGVIYPGRTALERLEVVALDDEEGT